MVKESKKYTTIYGDDEYGRESWLCVNKDKKTGKICVLSSEEGDPVVLSSKGAKELIEALKGCLR